MFVVVVGDMIVMVKKVRILRVGSKFGLSLFEVVDSKVFCVE